MAWFLILGALAVTIIYPSAAKFSYIVTQLHKTAIKSRQGGLMLFVLQVVVMNCCRLSQDFEMILINA